MSVHPHKTRYAKLVSAFAASAFALLIIVSSQLQAANSATASVVDHGVTMTNYRRVACLMSKKGTVDTNRSRLLNKACAMVKTTKTK
ncbi:MAG TPA: hypothetical protein VHA78_05490 [Candidatus Peribacteraceae bacterium]|nr:hypothetical protein [Candidatus Peribacteraceae bacterium]